MLVAIIFCGFEISQFGINLIWKILLEESWVGSIFFHFMTTHFGEIYYFTLVKFIISPNNSAPIIYHFYIMPAVPLRIQPKL